MANLCRLWLVFFSMSAVAAPLTSYHVGEVKKASATGRDFGSTVSLSKRTLDDKLQVIVEEVLHVGAGGDIEEYLTVAKVKGSAFSLRESKGQFTGKGKLVGKPWKWTGWEMTAQIKTGGSFTSKHRLVPGGLIVQKRFFDEGGKLRLKYDEDYKTITREMYDILHTKLAKPVAPKNPVG